jgi:hypothetical protein
MGVVLVVRAFIEPGPGRRLLVRLVEVSLPNTECVIGTVDSASAASLLVKAWLDSLKDDGVAGSTRRGPPATVGGDPT